MVEFLCKFPIAERCPSWSKEHDWKSCSGSQNLLVGSNPTRSASIIPPFGRETNPRYPTMTMGVASPLTDHGMFDFSAAMERLICHIRASCPEFAHVDLDRIIVACVQARAPGAHGVFASVQPLKFEGGSDTTVRRGRTYAMPELTHKGRQVLYIVHFALPRFMNMKFDAKVATVFHELYHISPKFNGDLRRFKGKYYAHGKSKKAYNELMAAMAKEYLAMPGALEHTDFLRSDFKKLEKQHGGVSGFRVRSVRPRLVQG